MSRPPLDVWDSCPLFGVLNKEPDKLPALLAQSHTFETGRAILGLPSVVVSEVVTLADGTPAGPKVKSFLDNGYVQLLLPTLDVSLKAGELQHRFDSRRLPELRAKAIAAGVPPDQVIRLKRADAEVLATAIIYGAQRLTTYDPMLILIGKEYITPETGLIIGPPDSSWLPFDQSVQP